MGESSPLDERVWESGWEMHTSLQRRRLAQLSFAEKLAWLEGAHELVEQLARARQPRVTRPPQAPPAKE